MKILYEMDSATLQRFTIKLINPTDYPLAYHDQMVEVYKTLEETYVDRCNIIDVAYIVPVSEVESGRFYLSGADNVFCTRYMMVNATMQACSSCLYFSRYYVEPFSVRLFTTLNTLSQNLRRSLFHQPESQISKWSFRLPLFPMESFWYLVYRIGVHGIGMSTERKQCVVKYFNTLRMECHTKRNTLSFLRILS